MNFKKRLKSFLFLLLSLRPGNHTLQKRTWDKIRTEHAKLFALHKEQLKYARSVKLNSFPAAMTFVQILVWTGFLCCYVSESFVNKHLQFLQLVFFSETSAPGTINENMGASATIIGLSFVVIGFLFESVRNRTQQTFQDIFRVTRLYYVFVIAITGMFCLVVMNSFKYTEQPYTVRNFATLSCVILLVTILSIGYLFKNVLLFLSDEQVGKYVAQNLMKLVRFQLLYEKFNVYSEAVMNEVFQAVPLQPFRHDFFNPRTFTLLMIEESTDQVLVDVYLPFITKFVKRIGKRVQQATPTEYGALHCGMELKTDHPVLYFEDGITISQMERSVFSAGFKTTNHKESQNLFASEKAKLEKRLITVAGLGDAEALDQALQDMSDIFDIYLEGEL